MTEKRIFAFRLPHQRDPNQSGEPVVDDVRDGHRNRKAEQDERQSLRRFHCLSLRERRMRGSSAPAPRSVVQQKTL